MLAVENNILTFQAFKLYLILSLNAILIPVLAVNLRFLIAALNNLVLGIQKNFLSKKDWGQLSDSIMTCCLGKTETMKKMKWSPLNFQQLKKFLMKWISIFFRLSFVTIKQMVGWVLVERLLFCTIMELINYQ